MKHNFPSTINVVCHHIVNLEEAKEILKLAIDYDLSVYQTVLDNKISSKYPYYIWDANESRLTRKTDCLQDSKSIVVSLEEFKEFMQGKGNYKKPYRKEIKLNSGYTAVVTKKIVTVGCQEFSHETIDELHRCSLIAREEEN